MATLPVMRLACAAAVGLVALKWSRKHDDTGSDAQTAIEPEMNERLDDELRNLD